MYNLNIVRTIKKICPSMKSETLSLKIIINKNGFPEESSYYSMKGLKKKKISCCLQTNKVLDSRNSKEHYESFLERKIKNQ